MGKFDNILLCTDLDGTLRDSKGNIPKGNIEAINYFMENVMKYMASYLIVWGSHMYFLY